MESKDKKASKLSYSEWFSFYMVILHNNIPLAHAYAKRAYSSQLEEVENDDIDIELENYKDIDSNNLYLYRPHIKDIDDKLHMKNKKLKYGEVSFELTAGNYTVGMDIPEGRYKIMAMKNFGNIYNKYYTFDENLDVDDEENKKEYLGHIRSNTNRLHQLVDILLKLAALDSGTIKMKKDIVNIKDMVGEIVTEMEILFADRGSTTPIIGENFDLVCDRKWTYEAIYNVVKNGIESSPKEGVRIILKETNIYKSIIVEDYSQGISDDILKKIYKRFYKENQNSKGYGIGLPMAKTIVEKQDGELIYTRGKTSNYFEFRFYI